MWVSRVYDYFLNQTVDFKYTAKDVRVPVGIWDAVDCVLALFFFDHNK